ncbi:uncharacterized protein KGF55_000430 [Candida pseudojiufengensis]|uniref:uncharacterized protein n=1 Tax=Candida pseudojiufengensis TaxID=497109 RepID=UPI0022247E6B|nr:uncharacterized protein KGF55_000430 [Candida pseudojiufengensis]KAI5967020.1 hypothetical protein KGF55_000430 [Candida pseudojiufengensis]
MAEVKRNYSDIITSPLDSPDEDFNDPKKLHTKPGRKPLDTEPKSKRTAQNRAAQRAYRERKERKMKDLEDKVKSLEDENVKATTESDFLKAQVNILKAELSKYRGTTDFSDLNLPSKVGHLSNPNSKTNNSNPIDLSPPSNEIHNSDRSSSDSNKNSISDKASTRSSVSNHNVSFGLPWSKENLKFIRQQQEQHTSDGNVPDLVSGSSSSTTPLNDNVLISPDSSEANNIPTNKNNLDFTHTFEEEIDPFCSKLGEACGTKQNPIPKQRRSIEGDRLKFSRTNSTQYNSPFSNISPNTQSNYTIDPENQYNDPFLNNISDFNFNLVDNKYKTDIDDPLSFLNDNNFDVSLAFGETNKDNKTQDPIDLLTTEESIYDPVIKEEINTNFNFNDFIKNSIPERRESSIKNDVFEDNDNDDNEVVPAPQSTLKCSEIWDRITAHPKYTELDIDGLCNELKNKAKCSEKGVVINTKDVNSLLARYKS